MDFLRNVRMICEEKHGEKDKIHISFFLPLFFFLFCLPLIFRFSGGTGSYGVFFFSFLFFCFSFRFSKLGRLFSVEFSFSFSVLSFLSSFLAEMARIVIVIMLDGKREKGHRIFRGGSL